MSKEEFAAIRAAAGMTYNALGEFLGVELRSVQRYESGDREISGPVEKLMRMLERAGTAERLTEILENGFKKGKGKS